MHVHTEMFQLKGQKQLKSYCFKSYMPNGLRTNLALRGGKGNVAGETTWSFGSGASDGHDC